MSRVKGHVSQGLCGIFPENRWSDIERVIQEAFDVDRQSQQAHNESPIQHFDNLIALSSAPQQNSIELNNIPPGMKQQIEVDPDETQTGMVYDHLLPSEQWHTQSQQGYYTKNTSDSAYYSAFNRTNDSPHGGTDVQDDYFEQLINYAPGDDISRRGSQDYPDPSAMG